MIFGDAKPAIPKPPVALTIAGSDSGGGAGVQADLKTFAAFKVHGATVLTLVTAQNTRGVSGISFLDESIVRAQYEAVVSDLRPAVAKTGALGSEALVHVVADCLRTKPVANLVVDPVLVSKHGDELAAEAAAAALIKQMLPLALIVTPNRFEASMLAKREVDDVASMKDAARAIFDLGAKNVIVKGAHLSRVVRDIFYDGNGFIEFGADRIDTTRTHGSGCVHSAAITARLAHGDGLVDAIEHARAFISQAIAGAPELGDGISPVHPLTELWA